MEILHEFATSIKELKPKNFSELGNVLHNYDGLFKDVLQDAAHWNFAEDVKFNGKSMNEIRTFTRLGDIKSIFGNLTNIPRNIEEEALKEAKFKSPEIKISSVNNFSRELENDADIRAFNEEFRNTGGNVDKMSQSTLERVWRKFKFSGGVAKFALRVGVVIGAGILINNFYKSLIKMAEEKAGCYILTQMNGSIVSECKILNRSCKNNTAHQSDHICTKNQLNLIYANKYYGAQKYKTDNNITKSIEDLFQDPAFESWYAANRKVIPLPQCPKTDICFLCDSDVTSQYDKKYVDNDLPYNQSMHCMSDFNIASVLADNLEYYGNRTIHDLSGKFQNLFKNKYIIGVIIFVIIAVVFSFIKK